MLSNNVTIVASVMGLLILAAIIMTAIKLYKPNNHKGATLIIYIVDGPKISFYEDFIANQLTLMPSSPKRFANTSGSLDGNWELILITWLQFNHLKVAAKGSVFRTAVDDAQLPLVCCLFENGDEKFEYQTDALRARLFIAECLKERNKHRKR